MIVIASQTINTNEDHIGHIHVELLKHDILDKFFVYSSDAPGHLPECINAHQAINLYSSYAAIAAAKHLSQSEGEAVADMFT